MSQFIVFIAMIISFNSLALMITSVLTNKWYTDSRNDIGIFGICEYSVSREEKAAAIVSDKQEEAFLKDETTSETIDAEQNVQTQSEELKTYNDENFYKCYPLVWPESEQAFKYLTTQTSYLIALMGIAVSSISFASLTSLWSFLCVVFQNIGKNVRCNEMLIGLSILTDVTTILTFSMFLCKDERMYEAKFYGFSLWLSVAAALGYFFTSILFIFNRFNLTFKYMLRSESESQSTK